MNSKAINFLGWFGAKQVKLMLGFVIIVIF